MVFLAAIVGVLVLVAGFSLLFALPTMWVVNYLFSTEALTAVFGGALTFWKAFWLNFACSWLIKSHSTNTKSD